MRRHTQPDGKMERVIHGDDETLRFIGANFRSVWALELLLALKRAGAQCTREDLVDRLRASDLVISKALEELEAAGLVSIDGDSALYLPANRGVEAMINRSEEVYRQKPNAVCRAIVSARTSSATAFADAFKLRKDER